MMIVKAYKGNGVWALWEADEELHFHGPDLIEVPNEERYPYQTHDKFPDISYMDYLHDIRSGTYDNETPPPQNRKVRWVAWQTNGMTNTLVTDGAVYICNAEGKTVEVLR